MSIDRPAITPELKLAQLLEHYPELEAKLLELSPAFARLRNPVLRRTVAKVTTLRQAAVVGGVELGRLINRLRAAAGDSTTFEDGEPSPGDVPPPAWLDPARIVRRVDIRPMLDAGEKPLGRILKDLSEMPAGQVYQLTAPFVPAPLVDRARAEGFQVWWKHSEGDVVEVYFFREAGQLVNLG
jgi:hypothetical protein